MKHPIFSSLFAATIVIASLSSCEDMMDTKTSTYLYDDGSKLNTASDSLYSAMGVLTQLQKIGERYVLLGELRGDMVDVTPTADFSLREISEFNISADNEYLSTRDYYSVINNCNYALARIDEDIKVNSTKVMLPEIAAIRAMRDWTYLQLGLNFGSVTYITEPILSLEESLANYPTLQLDELVGKLIADLEPYAEIDTPNYGNVDGQDSRYFFIQPLLLLGDLYLYNNEYENAAATYYRYIERFSLSLSYGYGNRWTTSSMDAANTGNLNAYYDERRSIIPYSSDAKDYHPNILNLTYNSLPSILPSGWWIDQMNSIDHFHVDNMDNNIITGNLQGDLRGMLVYRGGTRETASAFGNIITGLNSKNCLITKYYNNADANSSITSPDNELFAKEDPRQNRSIVTYRTPHVYLRYAEAVNRAGKPTLAFAVLKYGLNRNYMTLGQPTGDLEADAEITEAPVIDPQELSDGKFWTNFATLDLDNCGTAMRGRGLGIRLEGSTYLIPEGLTSEERIEFVEEEILREMAAETAFEGNRFFDLLRMSHHRTNHPALLAEKVSMRFSDPATARARLMNSENWWIKK